jgi:tetratricopeptide (TPR) repeat protein
VLQARQHRTLATKSGIAIDLYQRAARLRPDFWKLSQPGPRAEEAGRPGSGATTRHGAWCAPITRRFITTSDFSSGSIDDAAACYRQAIALNPPFADAYNNLGATLKTLGRLDDAIVAFRAALALRPDWAGAHSNLAGVFEWQGQHDEAIACHRRAMELAPDAPGIHGNYLFTLLFHHGYDARALKREHAEWNRRHAAALGVAIATHDNERTPGRRLRVGYVGGLFRDHVVGGTAAAARARSRARSRCSAIRTIGSTMR